MTPGHFGPAKPNHGPTSSAACWDRAARIAEDGDEYYPAATPGLWAGGHDEMGIEPDWNLFNACGRLPIFSARTYLSEAEMRPTVWLRWKDDPTCRML